MMRSSRSKTAVSRSVGLVVFAFLLAGTTRQLLGFAPISQGVVRIVNQQGNKQSIGTGTLIGRSGSTGTLVTCAHLFDDGIGDLAVFFDDGRPRHAVVIAIDDKNDLASVLVDRPAGAVVTIARAVPSTGTPLVSCGFGQKGIFRANQGALIGRVTLEKGPDSGVIEIAGMARQGDSGGPIFNPQHQLVAVLFGSNGKVVDGTHCEIVSQFLTAHPATPTLSAKLLQLTNIRMAESMRLFQPEFTGAQEAVPLTPPTFATLRGTVRYANRVVPGAKINLSGLTSRAAVLDSQGRFVFDRLECGHYELKVDTILQNTFRRAQLAVYLSGDSGEQEIEVDLK